MEHCKFRVSPNVSKLTTQTGAKRSDLPGLYGRGLTQEYSFGRGESLFDANKVSGLATDGKSVP